VATAIFISAGFVITASPNAYSLPIGVVVAQTVPYEWAFY